VLEDLPGRRDHPGGKTAFSTTTVHPLLLLRRGVPRSAPHRRRTLAGRIIRGTVAHSPAGEDEIKDFTFASFMLAISQIEGLLNYACLLKFPSSYAVQRISTCA
jgi:hypothetical protein